jgi:two-component system response regulator DevR
MAFTPVHLKMRVSFRRRQAASATLRDGRDAILAWPPQVDIIDSRLPDGHGIDLCRTLRSAVPQVALLLHCSAITAEDEREALEAGAAAVVPKSIRGEMLLAAIRLHASSGGLH